MQDINKDELEVENFDEVINSDTPLGSYGNLSEDNYEAEEIIEHTGIEGDEFTLVDEQLRYETGNTPEDAMEQIGDQYTMVTPDDLVDIVNESTGADLENPDDLAGIGQYQNTEDAADNFDAVPVMRVGEDADNYGESSDSESDGDDEVTIGVVPEGETSEPFEGGIQDLSPESGMTPLEEKSGYLDEQAELDIEEDDYKSLNGVEICGDDDCDDYEEDLDDPENAGEFYENYAEASGESGDSDDYEDSEDDSDDDYEEDDYEDEEEYEDE